MPTANQPAGAPATLGPVRAGFDALAERAEAFFATTIERHRELMQCRLGCTKCCESHLTVNLLEALVLLAGVSALPAAEREAAAARARELEQRDAPADGAPVGACALLDGEGCSVYGARPMICRTHGLPMRKGELGDTPPQPHEALPPTLRAISDEEIEASAATAAPPPPIPMLALMEAVRRAAPPPFHFKSCVLNFRSDIPPDAVFDGVTFDRALLAADAELRRALGGVAPCEIAITALAARGAAALPDEARAALPEELRAALETV